MTSTVLWVFVWTFKSMKRSRQTATRLRNVEALFKGLSLPYHHLRKLRHRYFANDVADDLANGPGRDPKNMTTDLQSSSITIHDETWPESHAASVHIYNSNPPKDHGSSKSHLIMSYPCMLYDYC